MSNKRFEHAVPPDGWAEEAEEWAKAALTRAGMLDDALTDALACESGAREDARQAEAQCAAAILALAHRIGDTEPTPEESALFADPLTPGAEMAGEMARLQVLLDGRTAHAVEETARADAAEERAARAERERDAYRATVEQLTEAATPLPDRLTVREACRRRLPLGGADAQALEGALAQAERELAAAREDAAHWQAVAEAAVERPRPEDENGGRYLAALRREV